MPFFLRRNSMLPFIHWDHSDRSDYTFQNLVREPTALCHGLCYLLSIEITQIWVTTLFKIWSYLTIFYYVEFFEGRIPKIENPSNHPALQEMEMKYDIVTPSKKRLKLIKSLFLYEWIYAGSRKLSTQPHHFHPRTKICCLKRSGKRYGRYCLCRLSHMPLFNFLFGRDRCFVWISSST